MIKQIFPINIYSVKSELNLSNVIQKLEQEEIYIQNNADDLEQQFGLRSKETYLLNKSIYEELKIWIEHHLSIYAKEYMGWQFEHIKITQSWISIKKPNQSHNIHRHPNSLISGVFYWQDNVENMYFKRPDILNMFQPQQDETLYYKEFESFKPEKYSLILFPSYLEHFVGINRSNFNRYCLPFNSMIFGKIGYENLLNELKIKE